MPACTELFIPSDRSAGQSSSGVVHRCNGKEDQCYLAGWIRSVTMAYIEHDPNIGLHNTPEMFKHFICDMERFLGNRTCLQAEELREAITQAKIALV